DIQRMITCMKKSQKVFDPRVNINYGLIECRILCEKEIKLSIIKTEYDGVILRYEDFFVPYYYRNDSLLNIIIHLR
ncbi:MAG: hypothetical protein O9353_10755, partial [Bacteroidia bacterium]|nr:hypothetical protein [Bacteroidia bacterium]